MKQQFFPQRLFMDMKRLIINRLVGLGLLVVGALVSCNAPTAFVPVPSPNPWVDDYTALSSMENYKQWGTYNVHDPACKKIGDTYYMYSTDAIFAENRKEAEEKNVPLGFIQVRKSKDLVHWDFVGWAFPEIPAPAIEWVHSQAEGKGATNIWAPFLMPYQGIYRLYYCVSAFGRNTSYIGMAESDSPEGPFVDFYGEDIKDTTNNVPILTAPYRFENHPGWAGTAHCGLIDAGDGRYFMTHQGRLSPQNQLMDLHVREVFFTVNGWPVVSPERYAGTAPRSFTKEDLAGEWEIIRLQEPPLERSLEAGQIMWGEGDLRNGEQALSARVVLEADGSVGDATWDFNVKKQLLTIKTATEDINNLIIFAGHDWENETETILFTGLDAQGHSVWGKRIN